MWRSTFILLLFVCVCTAHSHGPKKEIASGSGSSGDIYNVCPVFVDFSEEQESLTNDELKANAADAAMAAYLASHPNNTLWDYFKIQRRQKKEVFKNLPLGEKIKKIFKGVVDYTLDTLIAIAQMAADAIEWIINTLRDPLVGLKQIATFFKDLGKNCKILWGLFKEDPKETAQNMGGGLLLHITHHPAEFTAETVLTVGAGFAVIHGLMHGVEVIFGSMSNIISRVLLSVLMFIHAIDDPIYIVTPLITSILDQAETLAANGTTTINVTTVTTNAVEPLETCVIPEEFRPKFSTRDLCLSSSVEVRTLIFGTAKRTTKMTQPERIAAFNRFHDFVCCFLEDQEFEVNAPRIDSTKFEEDLVATPVKMQNCSQLLGDYSAATMWKPSASYVDSVDLDDDDSMSLDFDSDSTSPDFDSDSTSLDFDSASDEE
ncbi:hypothetical protein GN244_ATG02819 [Phytophthora infestans]|uniref:Secreted RxLR effector peptide protein n=1 Tax=Phytophthora infestans TaxID=4787 RepID=A0A833WLQ6_PHYIN|nr:hypothetical protein GN244_ATG02819 [Phytophthora infestans]KAF4147067.1 hypothetical protein GN958_ATG03696 [Phytophthora infestans]KAI9989932.1 hypothetical protein PInf_020231 [Phytophthora infestans]